MVHLSLVWEYSIGVLSFWAALLDLCFNSLRRVYHSHPSPIHLSNPGEKWLEVQLLRLRSDQCHLPEPVVRVKNTEKKTRHGKRRGSWGGPRGDPLKVKHSKVKIWFQVPSEPFFETEFLGLAQNGQSLKKLCLRRPFTTSPLASWNDGGLCLEKCCLESIFRSYPAANTMLRVTNKHWQPFWTDFHPSSENNTHTISILNHVINL